MFAAPLPAPLQALAPDLSRRFGVILANLAAMIARRFLREPRLVGLTVLVWTRINRSARRFERLMARLAAGRQKPPGRSGPRRSRPGGSAARLPRGQAWLVRALGYEAAAYASQLQFLLAEPGVADILAATPAAGRILRPLARMLGVPVPPPPGGPRQRHDIEPAARPSDVADPDPDPGPVPVSPRAVGVPRADHWPAADPGPPRHRRRSTAVARPRTSGAAG